MQIIIAALALVALYGLVLIVVPMISPRPDTLGVSDGRFNAPHVKWPNWVSSQSDGNSHSMSPISFSGSADDAKATILRIVNDMPRSTIVTDDGNYLHVEFRSLVMRFIDDTEFFIDGQNNVIHFRSAARLGYTDMGVNRRRMEQIRSAFAG